MPADEPVPAPAVPPAAEVQAEGRAAAEAKASPTVPPGLGEAVDAPGPGFGPEPVPAPPRGKGPALRLSRLSRRARVAALAGVVVAALAASLVIWSPLTPKAPSAVHVKSGTATTAEVSWSASGGLFVGHYLVLRDGKQAGSVSGGTTSWTDHGLAPGATYQYTVVADGLFRSGPSPRATVTTPTPSPVGLTASGATHTSVTLHWSPSPLGPPPDHYVVYNGASDIATVPGTATSYTDSRQPPGVSFRYAVVAQWGTRKSARSAAATGSTIPAALDGNFDVQVKVTSSPGGGWTGPTTGQHWSDRWYADAACSLDDCALTLNGAVRSNIDFQGGEFTMPLHHSGGGYAGSVKALVTYCGTTANSSAETDTITVSLAPRRGTPRDTAWTSWTGTMVLSAPVTSVAAGSCPAATWTYAVAGGAA